MQACLSISPHAPLIYASSKIKVPDCSVQVSGRPGRLLLVSGGASPVRSDEHLSEIALGLPMRGNQPRACVYRCEASFLPQRGTSQALLGNRACLKDRAEKSRDALFLSAEDVPSRGGLCRQGVENKRGSGSASGCAAGGELEDDFARVSWGHRGGCWQRNGRGCGDGRTRPSRLPCADTLGHAVTACVATTASPNSGEQEEGIAYSERALDW